MVQSSSISITPSKHADRHVVGGADPLTGTILVSPHNATHESGGSDHIGLLASVIPDNDTEQSLVGSGATAKKKETTLSVCVDTLEIAFDVYRVGSAGTFEAQIRRDGVNVGSVRVPPLTNYQTFVETISGWNNGDALQIYIAASSGTTIYVRNLRVVSMSRLDQSGLANDP